MRLLSRFAVVTTVAAIACTDPTAPPGPPALAGPRLDGECTNLAPCTEDPNAGGYLPWVFFGTYGDPIYEAPGDPSPGAPGVWLGATVTPATCFNDQTRSITDADFDWLDDTCEREIARGFAPAWNMSRQDNCPDGEPAWAAKYFPSAGFVRVAYMPAYYEDCGHGLMGTENTGGAHNGDSEFAMVQVEFNATTQHWEFRQMWLSAHSGASFGSDRSQWADASGTTFSRRYLAHPSIAVSDDKHANYTNYSKCMNHLGASMGFEDQCSFAEPNFDVFRFPIDAERNAGSRHRDLMGCVASTKRFVGNGRTECFYEDRSFRGWHPESESYGTASSYRSSLMSDHFELSGIDWGPGPAPAMLVRVSVSGPTYVGTAGTYTWTAVPTNCNPGCTYQWRRYTNGGWISLGTGVTQSQFVNGALGATFRMQVVAYTAPGESASATANVVNGTYVPSTCGTRLFC